MTTEIFIVLALLVLGFPISKIIEKIAISIYRKRFGASLEKPLIGSIAFSLSFSFIIITLLGFLNISVEVTSLAEILEIFPNILTIILLVLLTITLTRLSILLIDLIIRASGLKNLIENYGQKNLYYILYWILSFFILFSFGSTIFHLAGYDATPFLNIIATLSLPFLILLLLLFFFSVKDLVIEAGKGIYLRYAGIIKLGRYVSFNEDNAKINKIYFSGVVLEKKNENIFVPYSEFFSGFSFTKTRTVIERLEDMKQKYVAQDPSFCGPASLSMVLKMFGFEYSQHEIGEKAKTQVSKHGEPAGTTPQSLIDVSYEITNGKVKGVWIDADHISDLRNELLTWLDEEALVIVDYKKSYLFSEAKKAHYSVCLGVNGDELLLLDPSSKAGGVYYADYRRVEAGMDTYSVLFGGKRGYIVLAKDGSTAYKRISDGIIYLEKNLYDRITKNVLKGLADLQHNTRNITKIFPKRLTNLIDKEEKITRLWRPKKVKEDNE